MYTTPPVTTLSPTGSARDEVLSTSFQALVAFLGLLRIPPQQQESTNSQPVVIMPDGLCSGLSRTRLTGFAAGSGAKV
jgi:hypothetical protein